jgi:hypothetical protein
MNCSNNILTAAMVAVAFTAFGTAQFTPLDALQKKVQSNPDDFATRLTACGSNDIATVPLCRAIFDSAKEKSSKTSAANHMIRRGFREDQYISFLFNNAKQALADDIPMLFLYSSDGSGVKDKYNPEFEAWSRSKGLTVQQGIGLVNEHQFDILSFFALGYAPIIPVFEAGLNNNRNELIATSCAMALAHLDDRQAIPLISARLRGLPKGAQWGMHYALAVFDGADADAALAQFVPDANQRKALQKSALKERGMASWANFTPVPFP